MKINMDKIKQRLDNLNNPKKGNGGGNTFKPQAGDQEIRWVPSPDGDPFKEFHFHWGLGTPVLCPQKNFGDKCPVCAYASSLWKEGTDESQKQAKSLFARNRFFSNIIVRGRESEGPKLYGYGQTTYQQLIEYVMDPDYGDITDVDSGRDFKLTYKVPTKKGEFAKTSLKIGGKPTALSSDKKVTKAILDQIKPVEENAMFKRQSTAEVQEILDAHLDDPYDQTANEVQRYGKGKSNEEEAPADLDSAIDDVINS
jgi:hypothetical protein